jgi:hypothetical protein
MESMVFKADAKKRLGAFLLTLLFLGLAGLTIYTWKAEPPGTDPHRAIFFGSLALWATMSCLGLGCLNMTRLVVEVDPEGITTTFGSKVRRARWDEVVGLESSSSDGSAWKVHCADGRTVGLDTTFLGNSRVLKSVLQQKRAAMPPVTMGTFSVENRMSLGAVLGLVAVGLVGGGLWLLQTNDSQLFAKGSAFQGGMALVLGAMIMVLTAYGITTRYILEPDRLILRTMFGSKEIGFASIEQIDLKSRPAGPKVSALEWARLSGHGVTITINSNLHHYSALRDRVLSQAPQAKVTDSRSFTV